MKIFKILLIILVPAMGIVGCKKSEVKPACNPAQPMESTNISKPEETTVSSFEFAGRASLAEDDNGGNGDPTTIYGSGEDDRNGGEKKKTK